MGIAKIYILLIVAGMLSIILTKTKIKAIITAISISALGLFNCILSGIVLTGTKIETTISGTLFTGDITLKIDELSAWFIILISITFITGAVYGMQYMKVYLTEKKKLTLHWIFYFTTYLGIIGVCMVHNAAVFLITWEIMAISAFILVIFESHKQRTLKAGINYLIQSHVAVILLSIGFIWIHSKTDSFSFDTFSRFIAESTNIQNLILFLIFFFGFSFKAGFVPFHTWLPHAHPAAPSHISGVMSGVLIKSGIYGILRIILLTDTNYLAIGFFILAISVITGIYGVMLAIVQHNLKRLLAYHSIENIGIIGIGIGIGCIGKGYNLPLVSALGFGGALLHTFNHSLFKSLLFYASGNIYQATHSMNIEKFGGLIKKLPHTSVLFLVASLAICGLPPFNGFVSEFLIYSGLFQSVQVTGFTYTLLCIISVLGLSLIGGLALLCFTKAYGTVFLGVPKFEFNHVIKEMGKVRLIPMYFIAFLLLAVGIFPSIFIRIINISVLQLSGYDLTAQPATELSFLKTLDTIGVASLVFIVMCGLLYFIRKQIIAKTEQTTGNTWGCGYVAPTVKMQYSASSFVRAFRKLAGPLISIESAKAEIKGIFPGKASHQTHPADKTEIYFIDIPVKKFRTLLNVFTFLQNGRLQFYIAYGLIFITLLVGVPMAVYLFKMLIEFVNKL